MESVIVFITGMVKLEMIASVLLLAISVGLVAVMAAITWFIVTKLPGILSEWLTDFNKAVEKLADSVARITSDVSGTYQNTVQAAAQAAAHDAQAKAISACMTDVKESTADTNQTVHAILTTLQNRPCIVRRQE